MSDINFQENMAKIGIEACEEMLDNSKEDTMLLLEKGLDPQFIEWEKNFRRWCREEIERDRHNMLKGGKK